MDVLFKAAALDAVASLSVLSVIELEGGVPSAPEGIKVRLERLDAMYETLDILPFTTVEASSYRDVIAELGFSRRVVVDRMIAATALANSLTLATLNPRDFRDVAGLVVEDWSDD